MQIPRIEINIDPINEIQGGIFKYHTLMTAIKYKVFSHLTSPATSDQLSTQIQTDPYLTEKLLNALTAMGLLSKREGNYVNTTISTTFFIEGTDLYQGEIYEVWDEILTRSFTRFPEILKTGKASPLEFDETRLEINAQGAKAGAIQQMVDLVQSLPGFNEARKALDLGGGGGINGMAFASVNPNLKVIIYDYPAVIKSTQEYICRYNMQHAVSIMSGDMTKDPIGEDYDIIFISECLYFVKPHLIMIFKKVRNALRENGTLICRHLEMTADETSPADVVMQNLCGVLTGIKEYASFRENDIPVALREAGFSKIDGKFMKCMSYPYKVYIVSK